MKNRQRKRLTAAEKLSNISDIPFDMMSKFPYIKMFSNREIIVEDAGKLIAYSCECIKVRQGRNVVSVSGNDLKLMCLASGDLRVTGFIKCVCFE